MLYPSHRVSQAFAILQPDAGVDCGAVSGRDTYSCRQHVVPIDEVAPGCCHVAREAALLIHDATLVSFAQQLGGAGAPNGRCEKGRWVHRPGCRAI